MTTLEHIKSKIGKHKPVYLPDDGSKRGAVVIPIFERNNRIFVLFTKRTEDLPSHKGQISFPGGRKEETDESLLACALRETNEEIGLPPSSLKVWGELNQYKTHSSNYLLSVFVCLVHYPFQLTINEKEVDEIIEVPLDDLLDNEQWVHKDINLETNHHKAWFFDFQSKIIWGATAEITKHFISLLNKEH
ncbi:MAG: CoA pyrophosphatase [Candidatus Heimdallarchaeota archaeon]|nr:CoA pyrophosphatase [Candidatus Heimdallarchaeota archaeon]MBY8993079.1 CoA pyrophosphatase [Candidatus Heimdallarchaeota archaeon]